MAEEKKTGKLPQNIILENRKTMRISGVEDIGRFDEQEIVAYTVLGQLIIRGNQLHISRLSIETGELDLEGEVVAMIYTDHHSGSGGFLSKLFR